MGGTGRHRSSVLSKSRKPPRSRHCSTGVKLAGTDLKREGLRLQPVDPLWLLVRQTWLEQDQGSGDRGLATASGTGDRLWTLGVSGPCRRDAGWRPCKPSVGCAPAPQTRVTIWAEAEQQKPTSPGSQGQGAGRWGSRSLSAQVWARASSACRVPVSLSVCPRLLLP